MKEAGYELTFGTENKAPLTWSNFQVDVLYLIKHTPRIPPSVVPVAAGKDNDGMPLVLRDMVTGQVWNRGTRVEFDLKGLEVKDRMRVKRLALKDSTLSCGRRPMFCDHTAGDGSEISSELYKIVLGFESLKQLLIVERHVEEDVRDRREEPWGYVECEDIDVKAQVWEPRRKLSSVYH